MPEDFVDNYDISMTIETIRSMGRDLQDGLKMLRLIGPDLDPSYNDQVGLAKLQTNEQGAISTNRSGKSMVSAAKIAAAARDMPLIAWNGEEIDCRQQHQKGRPLMIWCHDDQTEALTDKGWKLFGKLNGHEKLGTVNLSTDTLEFQVPTKLFSRKYSGDMIRFNGNKLDMLVTPEHRMVVYPDPLGKEYAGENSPCFKRADELCQKDRLKVSVSNWNGELPTPPDFLSDVNVVVFSEWLGFYIAEGCCANSDNGEGYNHWKVVVTQKKAEGLDYFRPIAKAIGFHFHEAKQAGGAIDFVVCSKALWQYLEPLGDRYSKYVPQWIKDAPQDVIRAFIRGYFMGDGHTDPKRGTTSASSASRRLIDDVQELLLKIGLSGAIKVRPPSRYEFKSEGRSGMRREGYTIKVWTRDRASVRCHGGGRAVNGGRHKRRLLSSIYTGYDGHVYCASVPNGTLITRRNGKPAISGNCIGLQMNHIGQTLFRLLFQEGAFRIIKDRETGMLRAWRPWEKWDAEQELNTLPGPPLIPPSEIDQSSWQWEQKAGKQVAGVKLTNGTQFYFYASTSDVKMGDPVGVIWIDEAIKYSSHYPEWMMRLTDYRGWMLWSTMRRRAVPALERLLERNEIQQEQLQRGERTKLTCRCVFFRQEGNPFLPKERIAENREFLESEGEDELKMRLDGGETFDSTLIYPFFNKRTHAAIPPLNSLGEPLEPAEWDNLAKVLHALGGMPPKEWTHEMILDPGAQKPAVLFCAVPPQTWRDSAGKEWSLWADSRTPFYVAYAEIYGKRYALRSLDDDLSLPRAILSKMRGIRFRRFIIDMQAGRQTPTTGGKTVARQYSDAFQDYGIESEETGHGFIAGSPDFPNRKEMLSGLMQIHGCGKPLFRVVTQNCPNLVWQLARNQLKLEGDVVVNKEVRRERNDLRVCSEYWISTKPKYVRVEQVNRNPRWVEDLSAWDTKFFGTDKRDDDRVHFGPGLISA